MTSDIPKDGYFNTTNYIINTQKKLYEDVKKLNKGEPLNKYELKPLLLDVLSDTNKIAMTIRWAIHEGYGSRLTQEELKIVTSPVITVKPQNTHLRLIVPPLQKKYYKGSYDIYYATKIAVQNFIGKQPSFEKIKDPCVLIYKRYVTNPTNPNLCDNDNWEMRRVTNAIAEEMLENRDSATALSFIYTTVEADKDTVEVTLISYDKLGLFVEYLNQS